MTYSIVAHDPHTNQLGVAVQTCNLAVGNWVPWAEPGVGAVATQAVAERTYGTLGLELLRGGLSPQEALDALLAADERREFRQVSIVDTQGRIATHTGSRVLSNAGSCPGDGFCTQANMMARDTVWGAMAEAYQNSSGDLAGRLLTALQAAEAEGGDIRGRQTAALLVVDARLGHSRESQFPLVDLRVDFHPDPVGELGRMLQLHRAYTTEYTIRHHAENGRQELAYELLQEIARWAPDQAYLQYLRALHLAGRLDRWQEGLDLMRDLLQKKPVYREYLRRDAAIDHFDSGGVSARLLKQLMEEEA